MANAAADAALVAQLCAAHAVALGIPGEWPAPGTNATVEQWQRCGGLGLLAKWLKRENLQIIHERIFGSLAVHRAVMDARRNLGRQSGTNEHGPVTYVQGRPVWGEGLSGVSIEAVRPWRSGDHWTVYEDGIPCGRGWKRGGARFLML